MYFIISNNKVHIHVTELDYLKNNKVHYRTKVKTNRTKIVNKGLESMILHRF